MCRPAARLLHVLLSVPVVIAVMISVSPNAHAQAEPPTPLVVVIDPGHGGAYNPAQPDDPYDPGAVAPSNGIEEKNVALAVSLQVRDLLKEDDVTAVLTRSTDIWMSIQQRSDFANAEGAADFVSVHFNSFTDAGPNGSLVLYPKDQDLTFAQTMSQAMATRLAPLGMSSRGVTLRDNWWLATRMPTVTVEPAFLSNTHDAALVATATFQHDLALAIRDGIETFNPTILQRKAEIAAWNRAHPGHPVKQVLAGTKVGVVKPSSGWLGTVLRVALLLALGGAVIRWPRRAWLTVRASARLAARAVESVLVRRAARRRRRRAVALRAAAARGQRFARPRHVYDELWF